jgi:hypothetical protein
MSPADNLNAGRSVGGRLVLQDPGLRGHLHVDYMISKPLTPKRVICAYGFTTKYAARQVSPTTSKAASK